MIAVPGQHLHRHGHERSTPLHGTRRVTSAFELEVGAADVTAGIAASIRPARTTGRWVTYQSGCG
jgi:hypothetical protein